VENECSMVQKKHHGTYHTAQHVADFMVGKRPRHGVGMSGKRGSITLIIILFFLAPSSHSLVLFFFLLLLSCIPIHLNSIEREGEGKQKGFLLDLFFALSVCGRVRYPSRGRHAKHVLRVGIYGMIEWDLLPWSVRWGGAEDARCFDVKINMYER